ncbi:hypothetical protein PPBDW_II0371 [Photobacterium kishitanii]|nr:hypothetical protein PPBDW_II0371 [Photobacterium kishitanii]
MRIFLFDIKTRRVSIIPLTVNSSIPASIITFLLPFPAYSMVAGI